MPPELREGLRGLCHRHGWSYAVFWRFDRRDPRLLVMEETFFEEVIEAWIRKGITQVHLVGEGTIGGAALSGEHQWIYSDTYYNKYSLTFPEPNVELLKGINEPQHQFYAGIKTIVIISLPSLGVVQFGSAERNVESLEFVYQVQQFFHQLNTVTGRILSGDPLHGVQLSTNATLWSNHLNLGSQSDHGSMNPSSSAVPATSTPMDTYISSRNPFQRLPNLTSLSSFDITSQYGTSFPDPNIKQFSSSSSNFSVPSFSANNCAREIATLTLPDERIFTGMPTHPDMHSLFYGDSFSSCSPCRFPNVMYGSGKHVDFQHSSSSSSTPALKLDCLSTSPPSSKLDHPDNFLTVPPEFSPEPSALSGIKDDHSNLNETKQEQASEGLNESKELNPVNVETEPINQSNSSHSMPAEKSVVEECSASMPAQLLLDNDMFEGMELDTSSKEPRKDSWDDLIIPLENDTSSKFCTIVPDGISDLDMCSIPVADKRLFPESNFEKLLESVVGGSANLSSTPSSTPTNRSSTNSSDLENRLSALVQADYSQICRNQTLNMGKFMERPKEDVYFKSQVSSWIGDSSSVNAKSAITNQSKKPTDTAKVVRKRARPGESTRPRPKDRQQIQDRVKELREIVPNGSKCSIDSLLDRTIKHMLFLQSITKYADKLKHTDEPKMIGNESGVVLKDNSGSGSSGATWAYEVAGRTMVCPILVEDINPPGLMLVEMLCDDRGFFLEIADIIHGFGLTILKGVMEIRESKVWARFLVEANREVTRMDIFLSLVQLSQQTSCIRSHEQQMKAADKGVSVPLTNYQQPSMSIPVGFNNRLQ